MNTDTINKCLLTVMILVLIAAGIYSIYNDWIIANEEVVDRASDQARVRNLNQLQMPQQQIPQQAIAPSTEPPLSQSEVNA